MVTSSKTMVICCELSQNPGAISACKYFLQQIIETDWFEQQNRISHSLCSGPHFFIEVTSEVSQATLEVNFGELFGLVFFFFRFFKAKIWLESWVPQMIWDCKPDRKIVRDDFLVSLFLVKHLNNRSPVESVACWLMMTLGMYPVSPTIAKMLRFLSRWILWIPKSIGDINFHTLGIYTPRN